MPSLVLGVNKRQNFSTLKAERNTVEAHSQRKLVMSTMVYKYVSSRISNIVTCTPK